MTAFLEQTTIDEHRNAIAYHPLMGRTDHTAHRAVVITRGNPPRRVMKTVLVVF